MILSSKVASEKVRKALHKLKRGTLKNGHTSKTIKNRQQAIATGLSQARSAGAKVPAQSGHEQNNRP